MKEIEMFVNDLTTEYGVNVDDFDPTSDCLIISGDHDSLNRVKTEILDFNNFTCDNGAFVFNAMPDVFGKIMICFYGYESTSNGYLIIPAEENKADSMMTELGQMISGMFVA